MRLQVLHGEFKMAHSFLGDNDEFLIVEIIQSHLEALFSVDQKDLRMDPILIRDGGDPYSFANALAQLNLNESEEAFGPFATAMKAKNAEIAPATFPSDSEMTWIIITQKIDKCELSMVKLMSDTLWID